MERCIGAGPPPGRRMRIERGERGEGAPSLREISLRDLPYCFFSLQSGRSYRSLTSRTRGGSSSSIWLKRPTSLFSK